MSQYQKWGTCFEDVERRSKETGIRYDWIVRMRTDVAWGGSVESIHLPNPPTTRTAFWFASKSDFWIFFRGQDVSHLATLNAWLKREFQGCTEQSRKIFISSNTQFTKFLASRSIAIETIKNSASADEIHWPQGGIVRPSSWMEDYKFCLSFSHNGRASKCESLTVDELHQLQAKHQQPNAGS